MTISALQAADKELGDQLYRTPKPKLKSANELAAEENAKMHRDFMKSIAPQPSFEEKVQADKKKRLAAEAAKAQTDAKGRIALAISGYQCYRENGSGVDYTATEMVQNELRTVKFGNDMVRTLAVVQQIIQELPDHPKMGDVARVVESKVERSLEVKSSYERGKSRDSGVESGSRILERTDGLGFPDTREQHRRGASRKASCSANRRPHHRRSQLAVVN